MYIKDELFFDLVNTVPWYSIVAFNGVANLPNNIVNTGIKFKGFKVQFKAGKNILYTYNIRE